MASRKQTQTDPPETDDTPAAPAPNVVGRTQTIQEDSYWEIDGKLYPLRTMDDIGLRGQRRLNNEGREFFTLWNSPDELTDDQHARMEQLLEVMFLGDEKVPPLLDAPKTILRKVGSSARSEVVLTFILAPLQKLLLAAAQTDTEPETEMAGVSEPTTAS